MSIKVAMKLFEQMPGATKWVPRQGFKNANICYKKRFAAGKAVGIDKVVTRNDGVKVIGHYSLNGDCTGSTLTSARGKIETNFGAQNFDKVIQNYPDVDLITLKSYTRKDFDKLKLLCYAKDEEGKKIHLGDQKHIFRFKTLNNLKSLLVKYLENRPVFHSDSVKISFDNFTYYQEAYEARDPKDRIIEEIELDWIENYNIKQKINTYIKILRLCRKGMLLQQAVNYVKECPV